MRLCNNRKHKQLSIDYRRYIIGILAGVLIILLKAVSSPTVEAVTDGKGLYAGGELHAFYPSNAVFSKQMEQYIDEVDSVSFAWSKVDATDPSSLNTVKGKNDNQGFYYPEDYLQVVKYAKSKGKSIQLNIYMGGSDGKKLLPYKDKKSQLLQAILSALQTDITQGEEVYYDGVVIDFEGLKDTDGNQTPVLYNGKVIGTHFTQFLSDLKKQLEPLGKKLYVAVNPLLYYDGYHYDEILDIADRVILMAHDYEPVEKLQKSQVEQYTGYDAIEPINSPAPIRLVKQAVKEIKEAADPSQLSKVWLQIAFDSAQWQYKVSSANGWESLDDSALSIKGRLTPLYKSIKARIDNQDGYGQNITQGYNNELQSPFIQYYNTKDKTWNVILYEDSRSITAKIEMAKQSGLGGISIWSLANMPDYNDSKGKEFHLNGWSAILTNMSTPYTATAESKKTISFKDKAVEQAVREKLGKLTGSVSVADAKSIYRLSLPSGVQSLSDLKYLTNLEYLNAKKLDMKDITTIGKLTNLRVLYLQRNQISDISPLKKLKNLQILSLNGNQVASIASLSGLTQLRELYLAENKLKDISALSKLTNLSVLNLGTNSITKISSLSGLKKLSVLYLDNNKISDLKPLSKLTALTQLYLPGNKVADISSLKGLKKLKILSLNRNAVTDLTPLAKLTSLEKLYLKSNKIKNVTPLKGLTKLNELYLSGNKISDYSELKNIYPNLKKQCDFVLK